MFVCCECCLLSGRGLCDELIARPEESYRLWCVIVCDLETSRMRRPWPALGHSTTEKKGLHVSHYYWPMMGFVFLYGFPELLLTLFLAGGYLSSSLAIATDAAHLLTDFASFMISLFALWVGSRPATRVMSFGWHRAEVLGALTSVLLIWVVTGILVYLAVQRVITRDFEIESTSMLITSGVGLVVNLLWVLEYLLSHKFYNETYWWWKEVLTVLSVWSLKCT